MAPKRRSRIREEVRLVILSGVLYYQENTSTEMTMLIALDSDNRASLRRLFDRYPCLHGNVAAVIEGGMGKVFADSQHEPHVALAGLDFHFLAGEPLPSKAPPPL